MRVYVISLPRLTERRIHIERQVRAFDHVFVNAVDGEQLRREDWPDWLPLSLVACGLSHQNAYRAILNGGEPGMVVEDDAILPGILPIIEVPDGDLALLYYQHNPKLKRCRLAGEGPLRLPLDPVASTAAYVITPRACEILLEYNPPRRGYGPDDWTHFPVKVWCIYPRPVRIRHDFASSLGYRADTRVPSILRTLYRQRIERRLSRFVLV